MKKQKLNEEISRIKKLMFNEQAFNDSDEPMMTDKQYNDYNEPSEPDYDDGLLSLHLVRVPDDHDDDESYKHVRYITFNPFNDRGFQAIREITNSELRYIKSKGINIDDENNKKGLHNILKHILTSQV